MNIGNKILIGIFVIILLPLFVSCAVNPVTGERELMLVSEEQELDIGKDSAPSLQWEFGGYYSDRPLESYLESIVKELWQNSERPYLPFKFHIQNTSLPNAFALPGYVAITRGLLSDMENEAQFAAVVGHEIGHVMARHTAQRISRLTLQQLGLAIGSVALEGKGGSDALLTVGAIGSSLLLLSYDREQEIQADRLGVKYMARLGYDAHEAIGAHKVLEKSVDDYLKRMGKSRSEDNFVTEMLSTHPRAEVRISEIQSMINELPPYSIKDDGKFAGRFLDETERVREINKVYYIYDEAENYYQKEDFDAAEESLKKAIKLDALQPSFYNLMGFIKLRQKDYPEAEKSFRKALSVETGHQPSYYGLGLVNYYRENYRQAVEEFKKSLDLFPNHAQTHLGLGKSHFHLKRYREAVPHLKNFSEAAPKHPEVHGLLGICYDKTGDVRTAVSEYRYQLQIAPDTELGRHARKRLAELAPTLN
ncbi:MAG: tetratricopeptide repeat protein [Nitrospiraceae bacterium]|nr:MAG: tetratricopeptide repeat protein [Nitrospiraceae bacterium]